VFSSSLLEIIESEFIKQESADARISILKSCIKNLAGSDVELMRLRYEENLTLKTIGERIMKSTRATHYAIARIHNLLLLCVRRKMANE
jgi:DNA-directed RNA polymerase specialized sigma subunit